MISNIKIKSRNVKIKHNNTKLVIENSSENDGYVIFGKLFHFDRKPCEIQSKCDLAYGNAEIKLLNLRLKTINTFEINCSGFINNTTKYNFVGIKVFPNTKVAFEILNVNFVTEDEKSKVLFSEFEGDSLLICPGYPSYADKYNCAFIHTRAKEYKKLNMKIDIAQVNDEFMSKTVITEFEGIKIIRT